MQRRTVALALCTFLAVFAALGAGSGPVSRSEYEELRQKVLLLETKLKGHRRGRKAPVQAVVRARSFELCDRRGKRVAYWTSDRDGSARLLFVGHEKLFAISIGVEKDGKAALCMNGDPGIYLGGDKGQCAIRSGANGPSLSLSGDQGRVALIAGSDGQAMHFTRTADGKDMMLGVLKRGSSFVKADRVIR